LLLFGSRLSKASPKNIHQIHADFIGALREAGTALDEGIPVGEPGKLRSIGFYLRSLRYDRIVETILALYPTLSAFMGQEDLKQVIRFAELSLAYFEVGSKKAFPRFRKQKWQVHFRQKTFSQHAFRHLRLAAVYEQFQVGDPSQNLESAFKHYEAAARILAQEYSVVFALWAADVWAKLASARLNYPTENRAHHAELAIEAFLNAKKMVAPWAASMELPPEVMTNPRIWNRLSFMAKARHAFPYVARLSASRLRIMNTGMLDRQMAGWIFPSFIVQLDRQLGIAYGQAGDLDKAIGHFNLALGELSQDLEGLRAGIEVDKGCAYLEAKTGDERENLNLAAECFQNAIVASAEKGIIKPGLAKEHALAILGDARTWFGFHALKAILPELYKQSLVTVTDNLRVAARLTRKIGMPQLLQEALFLLGKAYDLQRDWMRAYRALVLASRVADRLRRRTRTPRTARYLVGTEAPLDALLVRVALYAKDVPLRLALQFSERGRTVFLASQLRSLKLLPDRAREEDVRGLFERRRLWHEAELKLLERESAPSADDEILLKLRNRRTVLETSYFAELAKMREKFGDPRYDPDEPIVPLQFVKIKEIVSEFSNEADTALVEYYLTDRNLMAFVILPTYLCSVNCGISREDLDGIRDRWQEGYEALLGRKGSLHPTQWERGYLQQVLDRAKKAVEAPTRKIEAWERDTKRSIKRVIIVPHRFLHLVPLHAVTHPDGRVWGDAVSVQYAPSASVLSQLLPLRGGRNREAADQSGRNGKNAVCISYALPSEERLLLFHTQEGQAVAEAAGGRVLSGHEATVGQAKAVMQDASYIHFACHGTFDTRLPLEAGLELAAEDGSCVGGAKKSARLTLGEIFESVRLPRGPLVVLSACETGVTKVEERHEEYIGLPAGFLYAGASTVVSTLWPVADVGTWLLMRAFARQVASGIRPTAALRRAQQELRGLSVEYVQQQIGQAASKETDTYRREKMIELGHQLQDPFPFSGPYWWAGFTVNGLG
jgi:CHAT domain-containing protein/tetratricopeptide (TPR) repeat protein